uniref:Protein kinase domain-containing protein n=1 Tax=Strongyloides venezuelensis TaxID=75913 RepID=A0A0K0EXQ2_STRVS
MRCDGSRRIKRQILPNDKIKVFSMFSNISLNDNIVVDSIQSRINVTENIGNLVVFSNISKLSFPSSCRSFNLSLQNQGTFLNISNIKFAALSDIGYLQEESTRVSNTDESTLLGIFNNNVNLKVDDGQTLFQAINGTSGSLKILTRQLTSSLGQENENPIFSLKANHSTINDDKTLYIESESTTYEIMASIDGANIGINFDNLSVLLYNNYNKLTIFSNSYVCDVNAEFSNFSMRLSKDLFVVHTTDNILTIIYDLKNHVIKLIIQQPSDTGITLGGATVNVNNSMFSKAFGDELYVNSSSIQITALDDGSKFLVNANKSHLKFGCQNNVISLNSNMHEFQIINGSPTITIRLKNYNFLITISPKANTTVPLWLLRDNFNESQFGILSSALDSIITNTTTKSNFNNENYIDNESNIITTGHVTNPPSGEDNPITMKSTSNGNYPSTYSISNEVTLLPNAEISSTEIYPAPTTPITFVTQNLLPSTSEGSIFQTLIPQIGKGKQTITWQSTSGEDGIMEEFAVFQFYTESSRNDGIEISATISSIDLNNTTNVPTSQKTETIDNEISNIPKNQLPSTTTISFTNDTTTPIPVTSSINILTQLNDFPTPSPLIRSRYYNLFRKTRNIMNGENTYNAILKRKIKN